MSFAASSTVPRADTSTSLAGFESLNQPTVVSHLSQCKINGRQVFSTADCNFIFKQLSSNHEILSTSSSDHFFPLSETTPFRVYRPLNSRTIHILSLAWNCGGRDKTFYPAVAFPERNNIAIIACKNTEKNRAELEMIKILTECASTSPYLIQLFSSHISDKNIISIMPLYSGSDLLQFADSTRFLKRTLLTHLKIARDIGLGIDYLHSPTPERKEMYIHGDIKPENIFIHVSVNSRNKIRYHVKLGDFGATIPENSQFKIIPRGTPGYFSPEMQTLYELQLSYDFKFDETTPQDKIPPEIFSASNVITTKTDMFSLHLTLEAIFVRLVRQNHPYYRGRSKRFWKEFQSQSPLQTVNPKDRCSARNFLSLVCEHIDAERMKKHPDKKIRPSSLKILTRVS